MLEIVLIVFEDAAGVERRVDVDALHLTYVLLSQLRDAGERFEDVARFARDH